jgi:hypothetical protein
MALISNNSNLPKQTQIPDNSILDTGGKQVYLGNQFAVALPVSGTTAETAQILIQNPASSSKSAFIQITRMSSASTSVAIARLYSSPTFSSAGTAVTPVNQRVLSNTVSVLTVTSAPTVSVNGSLITACSSNSNSAESDSLVILDPGASAVLTVQTSASSSCIPELHWYEI